MVLHPPKHISSIGGLGVGTTKTMCHVSDVIGIGTEIWNALDQPWAEGGVVIARPGYTWTTKWEVGKPYIITKFFDEENQLVGVYCDVSRPVQRTNDGFEFGDLYLDVWQVAGSSPVILDEDELAAALREQYITADEAKQARQVAQELVAQLSNTKDFLNF